MNFNYFFRTISKFWPESIYTLRLLDRVSIKSHLFIAINFLSFYKGSFFLIILFVEIDGPLRKIRLKSQLLFSL
ncbi:hypothetical protein AYI69_g8454 [Smittium culicis]|uniref:Uncharacterized protein n=1 Tax=Smittium culicis TaxID=133412 RepID=A0A1R1XJH6_9FUNG|nr:hypothetical protein AYI69_g8454 [Smittium culicis]